MTSLDRDTTDHAPVLSFLNRRVFDEIMRLDAAGVYPSRNVIADQIPGYSPPTISKARWQVLRATGYRIRTADPISRDADEFCSSEEPSPEEIAEVETRKAAEFPRLLARLTAGEPPHRWSVAAQKARLRESQSPTRKAGRGTDQIDRILSVELDAQSPEQVSRKLIAIGRRLDRGQRRPWNRAAEARAAGQP